MGDDRWVVNLGIDKPQEWVDEQANMTSVFFKENTDVLNEMLSHFISTHYPRAGMEIIHQPQLRKCLEETLLLFFTIGKMKGLVEGEQTGNLKNLLRDTKLD